MVFICFLFCFSNPPTTLLLRKHYILFSLLVVSNISYSQSRIDSLINNIDPQKLSSSIEKRVSKLEDKLIAKSEKTLHRLERQEEKIYEKQLSTKDSLQARLKLAEIQQKYKALEAKFKDPASVVPGNIKQYVPHLDTLTSALKFLDQNNSIAGVKDALAKVESFDGKLQEAEDIKTFIREREEQLKQEFEQLGLFKDLKRYNKEVYYYGEQLKEYKETLSDPDKIEKKAIDLLSKTKLFQDFMKKNSMLASLFKIPGDPNDPTYVASLAGLQTRVQVNSLIQQQISAGGPNAQAQFQQNIQQGQSQLQQLKNKLLESGKGSSDDIMPEGFKPNNQKTKSFLKRLEYGTNIQTQKSNSLFPAISDLGLSVGYKLNDKSVIGVGASYKVGLGSGWNRIQFSSQGAGLRSYIDWKIKGSFWMSGGYEMNYMTVIKDITQLRNLNAWQQSGLIGISKVIDVKSNFFKKTKLQLLWDFLSYQQIPRTQPIIFRIGYNLN